MNKEKVKRVLQIRQLLSKSSVTKYQAMLDRAAEDNRARHTLMYHGAGTGRWTGSGIQPQNFPKGKIKEMDQLVTAIKQGNADYIEFFYGDIMSVLSSGIRGAITAKKGYDLICADFSSIEGRALAWLAGEIEIIGNYRKGLDPYIVFASQLFPSNPYEKIYRGYSGGVSKFEDMRFDGKTGELACGYQGGHSAIGRFAPMMPLKRRQEIVDTWRSNRQLTVSYWYDMDRIATLAVQKPGKAIGFRGIYYSVVDGFLHCKLPSGRLLSYYDPKIELKEIKYDKICPVCKGAGALPLGRCKACGGKGFTRETFEKEAITYMKQNSQSFKWERTATYGGKLVENITQAVARDIMVEAMLRVEAAGYPLILTVHDEIIAEVPKVFGSLQEFEKLMTISPSWASDLPIGAAGWRGERYRKD
jgi:DNA polymerase